MKKLKIDQEKCIGCGACTALCAKTFELNGDYKAQVKTPPADPESDIQNAIDSCPVAAISWGE
ncbi:ferredoxin [Candidatus Microgenomates bacterium]|nr:ferredoxin [Candidatus Microgenomates bacterium]